MNELIDFCQTAAGLAELNRLIQQPSLLTSFTEAEKLRKKYPAKLVAQLFTQAQLHQKLKAKFHDNYLDPVIFADRLSANQKTSNASNADFDDGLVNLDSKIIADSIHCENLLARPPFLVTRAGLEQASRENISTWRAEQLAKQGIKAVLDLGCGLGFDSLAFLKRGINVSAVELDPETASLARWNIGLYRVHQGDALVLAPQLLAELRKSYSLSEIAIFLDPARRTDTARTWKPEQFSPPWDWVLDLYHGEYLVNVKAAPGLPYELLPDLGQNIWLSDGGDLVETSLWNREIYPGLGNRLALRFSPQIDILGAGDAVQLGDFGKYLFEPDPAAIRAQLLGALAKSLEAVQLAEKIPYLSGNILRLSPWYKTYQVLLELPYDFKVIRAWLKQEKIGKLTVKKRGIELSALEIIKKLKPKGKNSATLLCTPTQAGTKAFVVKQITNLPK